MKLALNCTAGACLAMAILSLLAGCKGDQSKYTLDNLIKGGLISGKPSAQQMVAMAFDPSDADKRRMGVQYLSGQSWGLKEPYLKGYATLAKSDSDPLVRSAALRALGKAKVLDYQPTLIAALADPAPMVRWDAAVALDGLPGPAAIDPLRRQGMADESADVRASCAKSLRHYTVPLALQTLVRMLDDPSYYVRFEARGALVQATGRDMGQDSAAWAPLIAQPLTRPAITREYAWWDWTGAFPITTTVDSTRTKAQKPVGERPWWDWMCVTNPTPRPTPQTQPATTKPAK